MILAASGNVATNTIIGSLFMKSINKETRGTLTGVFISCSTLGIMTMSGVGGWLFENVSIYGPFVAMGVLDATLLLLVVILTLTGSFKK